MVSHIQDDPYTSEQLSECTCANRASSDHAEADMSHRQAFDDSGGDTKLLKPQDSSPKVLQSDDIAHRRKRPTVSFLLPGQGAQREETAEIWPDLVDMHKRQYNVAISPPGSHVSWANSLQSGKGSIANEGKSHHSGETSISENMPKGLLNSGRNCVQRKHSRLPQRCADSTGCHLLQPADDDCYCQRHLKAVLLDERIASLINGASIDEHSVTLPRYGAPVGSVDFVVGEDNHLRRASTSSTGLHKCELCVPPSNSSKSSAFTRSTSASSFNPPTPHPKIYGELSENDIRVRIAQVHDELRLLNLALARGNQTVSDSDSDAGTPDTALFYHGADEFCLSSTGVAKDNADDNKSEPLVVERATSTSET